MSWKRRYKVFKFDLKVFKISKFEIFGTSIIERFFRAPGPRTEYFERIFLSFNKHYNNITMFTQLK